MDQFIVGKIDNFSKTCDRALVHTGKHEENAAVFDDVIIRTGGDQLRSLPAGCCQTHFCDLTQEGGGASRMFPTEVAGSEEGMRTGEVGV